MITIDGGTGTILYNGTDYKSGSAIQTKSTTKTDTFSLLQLVLPMSLDYL